MRAFIAVILVYVTSSNCIAQLAERVPSIPPSPEAASIAKYGQYPVDKNTGVVKIDIPVYTVKSGELELPISFSYHASGNRVDDIASWVGLGWVLNAGGAIARTIKGRPDEPGYFGIIPVADISQNNISYLVQIANGAYDGESDLYTYNVSGLTGSFRYNKNFEIIQIPYTDNIIIGRTSSSNTFTIISDKGIKYYFTKVDNVDSDNYFDYVSSWFVTKIESANGSDAIYFDYDYSQISSIRYEAEIINITFQDLIRSVTHCTYNSPLLSKIRFKSGYIDFISIADRIDNSTRRLSEINIYNNNGSVVKKVELQPNYFISENPAPPTNYLENVDYRLKLDGILLKDNSDGIVEKYSFNYNMTHKLPHYYIHYANNIRNDKQTYYQQDGWGYYNGAALNKHFFTEIFDCYECINVSDRNVNEEFAKTWVLDEIVYPTGGSTTFEYESNLGGYSGGLRIKTIKNYDNINESPSVIAYEYPSGTAFQYLGDDYNGRYDQLNTNPGEYFLLREFCVAYSPMTNGFSGGLTLYDHVIEYNGSISVNAGKTEYEYEFDSDVLEFPFFWNHPSINLPKLTDYQIDMSWDRGQIKKETFFKNVGGVYSAIKSRQYEYQTFKEEEFILGTFSFNNYISDQTNCAWAGDYYKFYGCYQYFDLKARTGIKLLMKTTEIEKTNNGDVVNITNYNYGAINRSNNPHALLTEKSTSGSDGIELKTSYVYPPDISFDEYLNNPNPPSLQNNGKAIQDMKNSNIIAYPIQEELRKGSKVVSATCNMYGYESSIIVPKSLSVAELSTPIDDIIKPYINSNGDLTVSPYLHEKIYYDKYNETNGNLLQIHRPDNTYSSYVWGYNSTYPIANFENIQYQSIGSTLLGYINQLENYSDLSSESNRSNLQSLNTIIRSNAPSNSFINTYTYIPLIGITSQTDPNGITTYYEYDSFGRLKLIRDHDGRILKTNEYHYK